MSNKFNTEPSIGCDEAGCGGLFTTIVFAVVVLTKEKSDLLQKQSWFNEFKKFIREQGDKKNIRKVISYRSKLSEIFEKDKDYFLWCLSPETFKKLMSEYEDERHVKRIGFLYLLKRKVDWVEGGHGQLPVFMDRFWKEGDVFELPKGIKAVSNAEKTYLSVAIAEIMAISYAVYKTKKFVEEYGLPESIGYEESHGPIENFKKTFKVLESDEVIKIWNDCDKLRRKFSGENEPDVEDFLSWLNSEESKSE